MIDTTAPIRKTRERPGRAHLTRGFSLVEILISLGLFAIGMIAVVSLFPAAAILQRETNQEVIGEIAAQSAVAIVQSKRLTFQAPATGDLAGYHGVAGPNESNAFPLLRLSAAIDQLYPYTLRSYPLSQVNGTDINDCDLFWVPFIQDLNGDATGSSQQWVMRIFLLEKDSRITYTGAPATDANPSDPDNFPKVRSIAIAGVADNIITLSGGTDLEASDIVMDSNGNDHVITAVNGDSSVLTVLRNVVTTPQNPTRLWYAPRFGGTSSPAQRVVTVKIDVPAP
ncbi:MAG: type IV pilus modification PilV family protein [Phycisphaeraceae bacterium]